MVGLPRQVPLLVGGACCPHLAPQLAPPLSRPAFARRIGGRLARALRSRRAGVEARESGGGSPANAFALAPPAPSGNGAKGSPLVGYGAAAQERLRRGRGGGSRGMRGASTRRAPWALGSRVRWSRRGRRQARGRTSLWCICQSLYRRFPEAGSCRSASRTGAVQRIAGAPPQQSCGCDVMGSGQPLLALLLQIKLLLLVQSHCRCSCMDDSCYCF